MCKACDHKVISHNIDVTWDRGYAAGKTDYDDQRSYDIGFNAGFDRSQRMYKKDERTARYQIERAIAQLEEADPGYVNDPYDYPAITGHIRGVIDSVTAQLKAYLET